jgi:hypothetical protein
MFVLILLYVDRLTVLSTASEIRSDLHLAGPNLRTICCMSVRYLLIRYVLASLGTRNTRCIHGVLGLCFTVEFSEALLRNTHVGISWGILELYNNHRRRVNLVPRIA